VLIVAEAMHETARSDIARLAGALDEALKATALTGVPIS
jgi:hypothetical protein